MGTWEKKGEDWMRWPGGKAGEKGYTVGGLVELGL